ncbi:MAG: pyridoxamine 5'-phosphate oxidase family protein [Desulfobacterales bacterium]
MSRPAASPAGGDPAEAREVLRRLLAAERFAVLATEREGQPYANLVAFAPGESLATLFFLTPRSTRKYENLKSNPRVALLVADSRNRAADLAVASAATGIGEARELAGEGRSEAVARFLARHPALEDFAQAPTCAVFAVGIRRYILVRRFQEVTEIAIEP